MKYKKTKPGAWSPRHVGYTAMLDGERVVILAGSQRALRKFHKRLLPLDRFNPKFCHPATFRRIGT